VTNPSARPIEDIEDGPFARRSGAWCNLLTWNLVPAKENLMGKQYNKLLKRRRRLNYLKRKHKAAKA